MAATTAKTRQDVDNQSARERLWDSLNYSYGQRGEELAQNYDKAISQSNNAMLQRGMQRSSYGAQINANLLNQKNKALAGNTSELISAYQDRLGQIEQQEQEQANWEKSFGLQQEQLAENKRQFNENLSLNKEQFAEQKAQNAWSQNFQQQQADIAQQNTLWNQKFQEANANREQANADRAYNYQVGRDTVSDAQWEKENARQDKQLDYNISSGDRAYYASWVQQAAALDNDVSDEMLAKAGISRDDFNAMRAEAAAVTYGGGGGGGRYYSPKGNPDDAATGLSDEDIANLFGSNAAYIAGQTAAKAAGKNKSSKGSGVIVNNPNYWTTAYKKKG